MPEDTPETPESETVLDSRKAKIVLLFTAAPNAALLFLGLYVAAIWLDLLPGTSLRPADAVEWARWAFVNAYFLAMALIALYFVFKIWLRPTLKNLRRVPFVAAVYGGCIYTLLSDISNYFMTMFLMMNFSLVFYFVVKKVMVSWLEMPELKHSGLSIATKRGYWGLYCFSLWSALQEAMMDALEPYGVDWELAMMLDILVPIALAVTCYYVGKRAWNLNQG